MVFKMKLVLLTLSIYVSSLYLEYVVGAPKTCKQLAGELTKRQLGALNNCTKMMKFKNGKEKTKKATCILKCAMRNENVLNSDYKLDDETIASFVNRELPAGDLADNAMLELKACHDSVGKDLDPDEEFCKSYEPFTKCLIMGFTKLCP